MSAPTAFANACHKPLNSVLKLGWVYEVWKRGREGRRLSEEKLKSQKGREKRVETKPNVQ
jgi:hypothetical protein